MQTQTNTVEAPVASVNLTGLTVEGAAQPQLNLVPPMSAEELAAAKAKAEELAAIAYKAEQEKQKLAMARFDTSTGFHLETETVGQSVKKTVSKTGAVKIGLKGRKELGVISGGLTGGDLDAWTRMRKDELKAQQCQLASRLQSDNNWTGKEVVMSAKGNEITIKFQKAAAITVGMAAPTDEQIASTLGISMDELKAFKAMQAAAKQAAAAAEAQKAADAQAAKELAEEEAALEAVASQDRE